MRILFGGTPAPAAPPNEAEGLHGIRSPKASLSPWLASLTGLLLLLASCVALYVVLTFIYPAADPQATTPPAPLGAVILALVCYIPLHELLHLLWHPDPWSFDQSVLVIWPAKLQFGVYFEGDMSRRRWLVMRAAPFVALSLLPVAILGVTQNGAFDLGVKTFLWVLFVVNTVGSGADVAAMWIVVRQVPRTAWICFRGGRAYWHESVLARRCG